MKNFDNLSPFMMTYFNGFQSVHKLVESIKDK